MTQPKSKPVCDTCGEVSEEVYKCTNCGKPFDGERDSGGGRSAIGGSQ